MKIKSPQNDGSEAEFIGLDEQGSGLIKSNEKVVSVSMFDVKKYLVSKNR